jgi:hypothetical protein
MHRADIKYIYRVVLYSMPGNLFLYLEQRCSRTDLAIFREPPVSFSGDFCILHSKGVHVFLVNHQFGALILNFRNT